MGCFRDFIEGKRDFIQTMCLDLAQANGVPMSMEDDRASGEGGSLRRCMYIPANWRSPSSSVCCSVCAHLEWNVDLTPPFH